MEKASPRFMLNLEVFKFFELRDNMLSGKVTRLLNYFLALQSPSPGYACYRYSRVYFEAFVAFLDKRPPTIKLAWEFLQSQPAQRIIVTEKESLQAEVTRLAKGGLTAQVIGNLLLFDQTQ